MKVAGVPGNSRKEHYQSARECIYPFSRCSR